MHDHGLALSAVAISSTEQTHCATIANLGDNLPVTNRITKVWLNDFAPSPNNDDADSCTWTWSFMKCNGGIFSWTLGDHSIQMDSGGLRFALHESVSSDTVGHDENSECRDPRCYSFGIKSDETRCLKGSIIDERTNLLGPLPSADHRHLLYTGQKSRTGHGFGLYGVSDFDIGIPSSTGSVLLALSLIVECQLSQREQMAEVSFRSSHIEALQYCC